MPASTLKARESEAPVADQEATSLLEEAQTSALEAGTLQAKAEPPQSFLKVEKSRIYSARDFANKGLSYKQKAVIVVLFVLLALIFKVLFVDPFRTDRDRWSRTKTMVDDAIERAFDVDEQGVSQNKSKSLTELERSAEDYVRAEEGDDV